MKDINTAFIGHPKPLFGLFLTELWERFSYYGIRPLLIFVMMASQGVGGLELSREDASAITGIFAGCMYLAALPGGWLADNVFGQKRAIFIGSVIIALGHVALGFSYFYDYAFFLGLSLIVVGSGLFKTCASVMVGAMYKPGDERRDSGFTIFYMGINIGSFFAPLICGYLAEGYGFHFGLGAGGVGMLISLAIFYFIAIKDFDEFDEKVGLSENWQRLKNVGFGKFCMSFVAIIAFILLLFGLFYFEILDSKASSISTNLVFFILFCVAVYFAYFFFSSKLNKDEKKSLVAMMIFMLAGAVFFSAFEQQPTSYNLFANDFTNRDFFGFSVPVVWFQSLNPIFIIIFAPIAAQFWLYLSQRGFGLSSTAKFALGLFFAGLGFVVMYFAALEVLGGTAQVSMLWIVVSMFFLTLGEICLSPVGLSLFTKIAPQAIKSQAMGLWLITGSLGNVIAGIVGGNVDANKIELLPELFKHSAIVLFACALLLFLLKGYIFRLIKK